MSRPSFIRLLIPCVCLLANSSAVGAERLSYNRDVRPILADKCFSCHGADSAARQADLRLDQRGPAIDSGAIQPGDSGASELINRIISEDSSVLMPPPELKKPLTKHEIATLKRWVEEGAEYQAHWSFIAPQRPAPPEVRQQSWPKNAIDRFVLHRLESLGLAPAAEADPRTLFRRLHLDITGLPPKPELTDKFVREYQAESDEALQRWIDQLMALPSWGEHRARYWLDAARYADTHGMHFDNYREMWPYRDWVIRAFNANQPFDQFTIEQLAGDLLPNPTREQLIATGFQRCNMTTNEGGTIDEENLALYAADRVQTLGWVYMGLTTNCAQCHDHKFDPFTMKDYYALAAFFRNTTQQAKDGNVADGLGPVIRVPLPADESRFEALPGEIQQARLARDQRRSQASNDFQNWLTQAATNDLEKTIPVAAMLFHAPLNEGKGQDTIDLVSKKKLTAIGDVNWIADGKLGPAPELRAGKTFEFGDEANFARNQAFSLSSWVRLDNDGHYGAIMARMDVDKAYKGWDLWVEGRSLGIHLIDSWPDNALKVVTEKPVLNKGSWQHVLVTYDGTGKPSGVKIYIDGKPQKVKVTSDTLKADAVTQSQTPLRIGQRSTGQNFEGAVQDARIYSRILDESEANALAGYPLLALLKLPAEQRSGQQQELLLNHYLSSVDPVYQKLSANLEQLQTELSNIEKRSPLTHVQKEKNDTPPMANILMRGEYDKVGDKVTAATPAALPAIPEGSPLNRLGLAKWLVDRSNPLTARVIVNRFWLQTFGQGIVPTPEDFGVSGAMPSNPDLLDWLAVEFQESGWDVKHLYKLMLTSAAYRQSAQVTPEKLDKDRDNIWLSRGPRFRMDAEVIRDYALSVSNLLNEQMFGAPVKPYQPEGIWDVVGLPEGNTRIYQPSKGADLYRRSLYTFWKRMAPPPNMEVFNAPSREVCSVKRERTNTPLQALVTLNDPQFVEAARVLATNAMKATLTAPGSNDTAIVKWLSEKVLNRPLSIGEQSIVLSSKDTLLNYYQTHREDATQLLKVGEAAIDAELDVSQLAAWTMVCNQLLNLDEMLNK
jgi:Protein of unknown function (DUF1553)/Protein of unknown function (DUF1549)/Concanavalin A-like lectin/glucanases superfamily/Planctomycete cytochrome C